VGQKTAVDDELCAGDERRIAARQERNRTGDLGCVCTPPERRFRDDTTLAFVLVHRCADASRADSVRSASTGRCRSPTSIGLAAGPATHVRGDHFTAQRPVGVQSVAGAVMGRELS